MLVIFFCFHLMLHFVAIQLIFNEQYSISIIYSLHASEFLFKPFLKLFLILYNTGSSSYHGLRLDIIYIKIRLKFLLNSYRCLVTNYIEL